PVNDAPDTAAGSGSGNQNTTIAVSLSGSDVDGSVASFKITSLPVNGTLFADAALTDTLLVGESVTATGNAATVFFQPNLNTNGPDSFTYAAVDNNGAQDPTPATASITVQNPNADNWINPAGGPWTTAANWDQGVPISTTTALLNAAGTYTVTSSGNVTI